VRLGAKKVWTKLVKRYTECAAVANRCVAADPDDALAVFESGGSRVASLSAEGREGQSLFDAVCFQIIFHAELLPTSEKNVQ
jgi:hypothetical protein